MCDNVFLLHSGWRYTQDVQICLGQSLRGWLHAFAHIHQILLCGHRFNSRASGPSGLIQVIVCTQQLFLTELHSLVGQALLVFQCSVDFHSKGNVLGYVCKPMKREWTIVSQCLSHACTSPLDNYTDHFNFGQCTICWLYISIWWRCATSSRSHTQANQRLAYAHICFRHLLTHKVFL